MGLFTFLSVAASAVIFIWACYCILSPCVADGVLGKFFFILAAVASLLDIMGAQPSDPGTIEPKSLILIAVAAIVARHFLLKPMKRKQKGAKNAPNHA